MKRAFIVCGPESCGNRILTRILVAAGCYGDGKISQRLDYKEPAADLIVWARSFPHAGRWPNLVKMIAKLEMQGYEVTALVPTRDWFATAISQVEAMHVPTLEWSDHNQQAAYKRIFAELDTAGVPFIVVHYDSLVHRPQRYIKALMAWLDLPMPETHERIIDATEKRYAQTQRD